MLFDIASEIKVDQNQIIENNKNLTADQIRDLLIKAQPVEITKDLYNEYCCLICENLAVDPLICSFCEMAIICGKCKVDWQK